MGWAKQFDIPEAAIQQHQKIGIGENGTVYVGSHNGDYHWQWEILGKLEMTNNTHMNISLSRIEATLDEIRTAVAKLVEWTEPKPNIQPVAPTMAECRDATLAESVPIKSKMVNGGIRYEWGPSLRYEHAPADWVATHLPGPRRDVTSACTCTIETLMNGCQCGAMQKEREWK